jgi:capsular exopolysaccharide synthesis family protein
VRRAAAGLEKPSWSVRRRTGSDTKPRHATARESRSRPGSAVAPDARVTSAPYVQGYAQTQPQQGRRQVFRSAHSCRLRLPRLTLRGKFDNSSAPIVTGTCQTCVQGDPCPTIPVWGATSRAGSGHPVARVSEPPLPRTSMDSVPTNLSPEQLLGVLRRRTPWILLCVVLVAGGAYAFSKHQAKKYTATASLVFNNNQVSQQVAGLPVSNSTSPQAQQNTNVKLVQLGDMAEKTAAALGRGLTKEKVRADLSVGAEGESNVVNVAATAATPALAAAIANTYTNQFVAEQQNSNHAYYASALRLVDKQLAVLTPQERAGTAGLALQDRAQSLGVLAELRNGDVQVAQAAAIPKSPSSPRVSRNTILGLVLGLVVGLGVAFLLEHFDRRIREPKDLEEIYRLPLLGVVSESDALSRSGKGKGEPRRTLPPGEEEAFQLIRAHLRYFNVDRELRTLLVASAAPRDGKTTVARHLARAGAMVGSRVLLLELDLRRPTLSQALGVNPGPGVSDVLIGAVSAADATQTIGVEGGDATGGRSLSVIVAGAALPPNPGELLETHAMEALLDWAKASYDLVVIDTPPLIAVSDAFPLLRKVDGVIIVGRVGRNRRDVAERLHVILTGAGAPLLGVVANGFRSRGLGSYGYGYGYGHEYGVADRAYGANASPNGDRTSQASAQKVRP